MSLQDSHNPHTADGNRESFTKIHELFYNRLFFYAYKLLGEVGECEDMVQDVFIHYWEIEGDFNDLVAVKAYLYNTLNYKIRNLLRKKQRQHRLIADIHQEDPRLQDQIVISAEISANVRRAIQELPPQTGRVMELSLLDMSQEEIASRMNISVNTVKTLKKGGYRALRESLSHLKSFLPFLFSM